MAAEPTGASRRALQTGRSADVRSRWSASSLLCTIGLVSAVALLASAHGVAHWSGDPGGRVPAFGTLGIVAISLTVLSWSAWGLVELNRSRWWHVFCGRRVTVCAGVLAAVAGGLVTSLVVRHPFQELFASGRITAHDLVDVGCILGAVVSLTVAAVAAVAAREAFDDERCWGRSLGVAP